jgi:hypothetical protein
VWLRLCITSTNQAYCREAEFQPAPGWLEKAGREVQGLVKT